MHALTAAPERHLQDEFAGDFDVIQFENISQVDGCSLQSEHERQDKNGQEAQRPWREHRAKGKVEEFGEGIRVLLCIGCIKKVLEQTPDFIHPRAQWVGAQSKDKTRCKEESNQHLVAPL